MAAELLARGEKFPRSIKRSDLRHGEISTEMEVTRGPKCLSVFYAARPSKYIGLLARFKGRYALDTRQLLARKARQPTEGFSLRLALNGEGKFGLKLDPGGAKRAR